MTRLTQGDSAPSQLWIFLENLKFIAKTKKETDEITKDKKKKITGKEVTAVEDARKMASEITNTLIEYVQRKDFVAMDRKRFVIKSGTRAAEVFFLDKVYIVEGPKIFNLDKNEMKETNLEKLNMSLGNSKQQPMKMTPEILDALKKNFGNFELGY